MFLIIERIYDDRIPPKCPQKLRKFAKNLKPENANIYQVIYKLFSVVHHYLLWMFLIIERKYVDRIPSKCPQKLRKCAKNEKLKMRISTKPFYKLFSVVHNYFQWMFLVIDRIYDDRIPSKCPQKLRKCAKNEKLKMRISTKPFYKLFSVVHSYFEWMFLVIDRIYDDRIPAKCPQKLRKFAKNLKPENANIYQVIYKLFSVVHNYFLWMFLIIERKYVDRIPSKCPQKLRKCAKNEKLKMRISTKPFYKLFSVVHQLLAMNVFNHWEEICWSYPFQMSPKT